MKGFDFKTFAVHHGEKIVLGVVGLLVVVVLLGTTWKTFDKNPKALKEKAEETESKIALSFWPEEEKEKYTADDRLKVKIASMLRPIPGDVMRTADGKMGYRYSVSPIFPLYPPQKLLSQPKLYPVEKLIASANTIAVATNAQFVELEEDDDPAGTEKDGPIKLKVQGQPRAFDGVGPGAAGGLQGDGMRAKGFTRKARNKEEEKNSRVDEGDGMDAEGGAGMIGQYEVDGKRYVAVRGIYPLKKQLDEMERALNLDPGQAESFAFRLHDFELERQMSTDGGKTWEDFAKVDRKFVYNYLQNEAAGFDVDVVDDRIIHPVLTSPLPQRLLLAWDNDGSHPDIEQYRLSADGKKKLKALQEAIRKYREEAKKLDEDEPQGFSSLQYNLRGMGRAMMGDEGRTRDIHKVFNESLDSEDAGDLKSIDKFRDFVTAAGDLLLFRYIDLDVQPGMTYRYRVRVTLRNPNYGRSKDELQPTHQHSADTKYISTDWSEPTSPVAVPVEVKYFLTRAEQRANLRAEPPTADLQVFQFFQNLGTFVRGKVRAVKAGDFLAGVDGQTQEIDPGKGLVTSPKETTFNTRILLVDVNPGADSLASPHMTELGLSKREKLGVVDEVVVLDERGDVRDLNLLSQASAKQAEDSSYDGIIEILTDYGWLYDPTEEPAVGEDGMMTEEDYSEEAGSLSGLAGQRGGRRARPRGRRALTQSPLRRDAGEMNEYRRQPAGGRGRRPTPYQEP